MKENWQKLSAPLKVCTVISIILSVVGFILYIMQKAGAITLPISIFNPAVAAVSICEAIIDWNSRRKYACFSLIVAVIFIVLTVLEITGISFF